MAGRGTSQKTKTKYQKWKKKIKENGNGKRMDDKLRMYFSISIFMPEIQENFTVTAETRR